MFILPYQLISAILKYIVYLGLEFYAQCGWLGFSTKEKNDMVQKCINIAEKCEEEYSLLEEEAIKLKFPYLKVPVGTVAILSEQAGHINPRILVKAQQLIAKYHAYRILDDIVDSIEKKTSNQLVLRTGSGKVIHANKVLLATGAFTECRSLLPEGFLPDMSSTSETVLFVSIAHFV